MTFWEVFNSFPTFIVLVIIALLLMISTQKTSSRSVKK